jgi:2-oxoglutarate ferredoxin oxidoreductase subunit gamma
VLKPGPAGLGSESIKDDGENGLIGRRGIEWPCGMMKVSVRFAGMGGQGIIFSGIVLARAAALYQQREGKDLYAIQTQSYGPAARGESSKCDVVISDDASFYPFVEKVDWLVVMSQPAYERYIDQAHEDTIVLLDDTTVDARPELTYYEIPAFKVAEAMGQRIAANMVMLGALVGLSGVVGKEAVHNALEDVSKAGTSESNLRAFDKGFEVGMSATAHIWR